MTEELTPTPIPAASSTGSAIAERELVDSDVKAEIRRWSTAVDLESTIVRARDLEDVRTGRAALAELLRPLTHDEQPSEQVVKVFNDQLSRVLSRRALDVTNLAWTWRGQNPVQRLLDPIVFDAAGVASQSDQTRLRHCPSCDWAFYDETRNGRRRWCDMADCGSRAKSRSYYYRSTR